MKIKKSKIIFLLLFQTHGAPCFSGHVAVAGGRRKVRQLGRKMASQSFLYDRLRLID